MSISFRALVLTAALTALAPVLAGCGNKDAPTAPDTAALPAMLFVDVAPAGALDVGPSKASAKVGDKIVLTGRVGGSQHPFVNGRAMLTLAGDADITACSDRPGDECETPWDFCCDDPADILRNTATVQVTDGSGRPLKVPLEGARGIGHLSRLVVEGTVSSRTDAGAMVVDAKHIYVAK